mmetsp:Transcript_53330/g.73065  ORF Transcript_53330/g.73065 Transcript_53330/m.73065 type:complete len:94 (+) Transcript_53330:94-375(+)
MDNQHDVSAKEKTVVKSRTELGKLEQAVRDMEVCWQNLTASDKAHYKQKITDARRDYEQIRKRYFRYEDVVKSQTNQENIYGGDDAQSKALRG